MASNVGNRLTVEVNERTAIAIALVIAFCLAAFETVPGLGAYPIVRGSIGIAASLLAPGYLLLLLAGVTPRRLSQLLAYSVGVSMAFLVLLGLGTYVAFGALGLEQPMTAMPWMLALALVAMASRAYGRTADSFVFRRPVAVSFRTLFSGILLLLLPLLSVAATTAVNGGGSTLPTLVEIVLLGVVVLLVVSGAIPAKLRAFAIWAVAISVLWQMTLVSSHLWGWDVHFEYYTSRQVLQDGPWSPMAPGVTNSLLSVTFLAAVYSSVTGVDPVWVYKIVFPLVGSLLPVAVYHLGTREFTDEWVGTLAPFALIFYYGFFKIMPDKQLVSQVFLALVLVTLLDDSVRGLRKRALAVTFGTMVILSHYGVSLLFVALLTATIAVVAVAKRLRVVDADAPTVLSSTFVALLGIEWLGWYLFSATGENFDRVVVVIGSLITEGLGTSGRSGVGYATKTFESPYWMVYKVLLAALIGLLCVGVLWTLYTIVTGRNDRTHPEYAVFSSFLLLFLVASALLTFGVGFDRTLLLVLTALPPFAVVGLRVLFSVPLLASRRIRFNPSSRTIASVFAVFLVVLFLFSSGAAFAMADQDVPAYSINLDKDAGWPVYDDSEVAATRWLDEYGTPGADVAVYNQWSTLKSRDAVLVREVVPTERVVSVLPTSDSLDSGEYVYVSDKPMVTDIVDMDEYIDPEGTEFYRERLFRTSNVYSSGDARIYLSSDSDDGGDQASDAGSNAAN